MNLRSDQLVCSTICFRSLDVKAALAAVRETGVAAVDLGVLPGYCEHFAVEDARPGALAAWSDVVRGSGLRVHTLNTAIGAFNDDTLAPETVQLRARRCLEAAVRVGARGVTFSPGLKVDRQSRPLERELERVGRFFRQLAAEAADRGLSLSFEAPHRGGLIQDAHEAVALVAACDHPNARLIFDVGHHLRAGGDLLAAWQCVGHLVTHVHLKDQANGRGCYPLGTGAVDFRALFAAMTGSGYAGCYGFEFPDAAPTPAAVVDLVRRSRQYLLDLAVPERRAPGENTRAEKPAAESPI